MDLNKIYVQHSSLSGIAQSLQTVVSNIKSMESAMDYLTDQSNTMWEGKAIGLMSAIMNLSYNQ